MQLHNTAAIVLRNSKIGDADRVVTFFTLAEGKISAVAKGAGKPRSKFGGSLQPLTLVQLIFLSKENTPLGRVSSVDILHSFQELRENWEKTTAALYAVELVERFSGEGEKNPALFTLFSTLLHHLEVADSARLGTLLRIFEIRLLSVAGYAPLLDRCVRCNRSVEAAKSYSFSPARGGWFCHLCQANVRQKFSITAGSLRFLQKAMTMDLQKIDRLGIPVSLFSEIRDLLHRMIILHAGSELKSYRFLQEASPGQAYHTET